MTGVELDRALDSFGGECGLVFTLDETRTINVPVAGSVVQIPELGFMLVCKVKNDTIFDLIDSTLNSNPLVIRTDRNGLKMRTLPSPTPVPLNLRPSIARSGDYLFVASNDALIETALAVKSGTRAGLKSTDEFKKLSQGVQQQGNSLTFRSQRVADTIARLQTQLLAGNPATNDPAQAQLLTKLFGFAGTAGGYGVAANTDEGWLSTGNSGQNPATTFLLLPSLAVTGIIATIAIPSLLRSRQAANESSAVAILRTIATAEVTYLATSRGSYGDMRALVDAGLLDPRIKSPVSGYSFTIIVSGRNFTARANPVSPNDGRYGYFVTSDAVVRYSAAPAEAPPGQGGNPVQ